MKPIIRTILSTVQGLEMWMTAFPIIRCLIEGHEPNGEKRLVDERRLFLCTRCKLVYWEEK